MSVLTTTSRGQITLRKEIFQHLGVKPGEKLEIEMLPNGRLQLQAAKSRGKIEDFLGCLTIHTDVKLTLDEMNEAIKRS